MLGNDFVAKATADGHTLVLTDRGTLTIGPSIVKNMLFNLHKDLAPVTTISFSPYLVVTSPKHAVRTLKELIDYSKANPDKLNVATAGMGSNPHLAALQFATALGLKWTFIPSKGGAQALQDVAGGHADLRFNSMLATAPHVKSGNVRLIAVTSAKRVGAEVIANSPEQMDAFLRADRERLAKVIRDSGLKIEQ